MNTVSRSSFSSRDRRGRHRRNFKIALSLLLVAAFYFILTSSFLETWVLHGEGMSPGYPEGTRVLVRVLKKNKNTPSIGSRFQRGDVVKLNTRYAVSHSGLWKGMNALLRFVTLQKISMEKKGRHKWESSTTFKRIIGIPGDTIMMKNFGAYVKEYKEELFLNEQSAAGNSYRIKIPEFPAGWEPDMPFSGNLEPVDVPDGEYFVLGDNRSSVNDSRYWGLLKEESITGRIVFVYWPISMFGRVR